MERSERVRRHYNGVSRNHMVYHTNVYAVAEDRKYSEILQPFFAEGRLNVLDIGCGHGLPGPLSNAFMPRIGHYTGVDLSSRMLAQARRFLSKEIKGGKAELHHADLVGFLPTLADDTYDRVTAIHGTLSLVDRSNIPKIISQCHRILRANGYGVFDMINRRPGMPRHIRNYENRCIKGVPTTPVDTYTPQEMRRYLEDASFEVELMAGLNVIGASKEVEDYFVRQQKILERGIKRGAKDASEKLERLRKRAEEIVNIDFEACQDDLSVGHSLIAVGRKIT